MTGMLYCYSTAILCFAELLAERRFTVQHHPFALSTRQSSLPSNLPITHGEYRANEHKV